MIEIAHQKVRPFKIEDESLKSEDIIQACLQLKQFGQNVPDPDHCGSGGFTQSMIDQADKWTERAHLCMTPALIGQRPDGSAVSYLSHVTPTGFYGGFLDLYEVMLEEFAIETTPSSRQIVIAGGVKEYFIRTEEDIFVPPIMEYHESLDALFRKQEQMLGKVPTIVVPGKEKVEGSMFTNVYINTSRQKVFVVETNAREPKLVQTKNIAA